MNPIPVTLPPTLRPRPTRMQSRPLHPELAVEHDRFVEMLPELMKTLRDKWIALKDGEIVAVGDSEVRALTAANRLRPGVMFLARKVTDQPLPIERLPILRECPKNTLPDVDRAGQESSSTPAHPEGPVNDDR